MTAVNWRRVGIGTLREFGTAVGTWIAFALGLTIWHQFVHGSPEQRRAAIKQENPAWSEEMVTSQLEAAGGTRGPLEFLVDTATFQWGVSPVYQEPVAGVVSYYIPQAVIFLVAVSLIATAVLALIALAVSQLSSPDSKWPWALGAVGGTVVPILVAGAVLVALFVLEIPWLFQSPSISGPTLNPVPILLVAVVVAIPIVADGARRLHRAKRRTAGHLGRLVLEVLGRDGGIAGILWGSYAVGALFMVHSLFRADVPARLFIQGLREADVPLLVGTTSLLVAPLVAVKFSSGLIGVLHEAVEDPDEERSQSGTERTPVRSTKTFRAGLALLALGGLAGAVGTLLLSPRPIRETRSGLDLALGPGQVLTTTWSLLVVTATALVVAAVLGGVAGVVSGVARERYGLPGGVLASIVRLPGEAALAVPIVVSIGLVSVMQEPANSPFEGIWVGAAGGLVVAGATVRIVDHAMRRHLDAPGSTTDRAMRGLRAVVPQLEFPILVLVFAVGELVLMGHLATGLAPAFVRFNEGISMSFQLISSPLTLLPLMLQAGLATLIPVAGVLLVAHSCQVSNQNTDQEESA